VSKENENGKTTGNTEADIEAAAEDIAVIDDFASQLEAVTVERDELASEKEDLVSQVLRQRADYENLRRRTAKEKADIADYASGEAIAALLPILDDFERALNAVPPEIGDDNEYVKGIAMIEQRLFDALKKVGLEAFDSVGKPFDPNIHHAVKRVETDDTEEDTVIEEWQRGYNFRGKLLREAMVKVAVRSSSDG
jgi:molecular chaperone GrpE